MGKAIEDAMERNRSLGILERRYGGFEEAMQRSGGEPDCC